MKQAEQKQRVSERRFPCIFVQELSHKRARQRCNILKPWHAYRHFPHTRRAKHRNPGPDSYRDAHVASTIYPLHDLIHRHRRPPHWSVRHCRRIPFIMAAAGKPVNVYIHRQAGTPKSCFVCHKQSPHVLVSQSIPTLDFLYVCHAHLADRHFATKLSDPASSSASTPTGGAGTTGRLPDKVSQEEIDKIKAEYEAKLKAKDSAKDKDKDKDKESKPFSAMSVAGSVFSTVTSTVSGLASSAIGSIPTEAPQPAPATPSPTSAESLAKQHPLHAKYALHREFYAARVREWNNKMVKKKEKELNMPPAPKNALS